MAKDRIILDFVQYHVSPIIYGILWDGTKAWTRRYGFEVLDDVELGEAVEYKNLNRYRTGDFQCLLGVRFEVFKVYTNGETSVKRYDKTIRVGESFEPSDLV